MALIPLKQFACRNQCNQRNQFNQWFRQIRDGSWLHNSSENILQAQEIEKEIENGKVKMENGKLKMGRRMGCNALCGFQPKA